MRNLTLVRDGDDFRLGPRCPDCEWVGPMIPLSAFGPKWRWQVQIKAVVTMYWWHLLFSRRHAHWEWSQ